MAPPRVDRLDLTDVRAVETCAVGPLASCIHRRVGYLFGGGALAAVLVPRYVEHPRGGHCQS